jgi:tripartite-type tricarboxylate transporter receptor subunit TctC
MLVVHPSLPVRSVKEFVALGKARPDQIVYGSSGRGCFVHLASRGSNEGVRPRHRSFR